MARPRVRDRHGGGVLGDQLRVGGGHVMDAETMSQADCYIRHVAYWILTEGGE